MKYNGLSITNNKLQLKEGLEMVKYDSGLRALIIRSLVPGTFCAGNSLNAILCM